jgi:putative flippase GtrA
MKRQAERFGIWIIRLLDVFYPLFKKFLPSETYRYLVTGGMNMLLDIFLYFIFYHFVFHKQIVDFGFLAISPHIAAFVFVFPITFSIGFFLAKFVTFTESPLKGKKQLIRYSLSVIGSIILNYILLKLFVEHLHFFPTISKLLTTILVVMYSFLIQKFFTFKTGKKQIERIISQNEL